MIEQSHSYELSPQREKVFWDRAVGRPDTSACWLWSGTVNSYGYGLFGWNSKTMQAHRIAYSLAVGPIPKGFCVCHTCDVRLCVNPSHLFAASIADNNADRARKGRNRDQRGEKNSQCKIPARHLPELFSMRSSGKLQREIAAHFGVSQTLVGRILRGDIRKDML